ncbi:MAG: hypothetical protein ACK40G_13310 [Cytophagaceae bacterium]
MAISFESLRVGKKYYLKNHGEKISFLIEEKTANNDFLIKDIYTLEKYFLSEFVKYGKGKDYDLREL